MEHISFQTPFFRLTLNEFACFDGSVPARNAGYGISRLLRAL